METTRGKPMRRRLTWMAVGIAAAAGLFLVVPRTSQAGDLQITVPPDGMTVPDLLTAVSVMTKWPITWNSNDKALLTARIQSTRPITAKESRFLDVVRAVLFTREIVLVPVGDPADGVYFAANLRELSSYVAMRMKPEFVEVTGEKLGEMDGQDGRFVTATIPVHNLDNLRDARAALQRLITGNNIGSVQELPAASAFVVTDFAPNVAAIFRVIRAMDAAPPRPKARTEFVTMRNASAAKVASVLHDLFPAAGPTPPAPQGAPNGEPRALRIVPDAWTNQVVVSGPAGEVDQVLAAIEHLDLAAAPPPREPAGK